MRFIIATAAVLVMATAISPGPGAIQISGTPVAAQEQQPAAQPATPAPQQPTAQPTTPAPKADIDINVNHGGRTWYASPVWIAIGAIAVVLVIVLIATVARGGGTTVIKE